jgi:hypothetical protein
VEINEKTIIEYMITNLLGIDYSQLPLIPSIVVIIVFLVVVTIVIILLQYKRNKRLFNDKVNQRINFYNVYRIQFNTGLVYKFSPRQPQVRETFSFQHFLKFFSLTDAKLIEIWITELLKGKSETPWIFQAHLVKKIEKRRRQSIFEVAHIDYAQQRIQLHQYPLNFLKPLAKKRDLRNHIINIKQGISIVKKLSKKDGAFYYLQMQYTQSELDDQFKTFYLTQFKEKILPYLNNNLLLLDTSNHILLLNLKGTDSQEHMRIAQTIIRIISQYIEVNGLENSIKFNLAVIQHKYAVNDFNLLLRLARELSQLMAKKKIILAQYDPIQPLVQTLEENQEKFYQEVFVHFGFNVRQRPALNFPLLEDIYFQYEISHQFESSLDTFDMLYQANEISNAKEFFRRYLFSIHAKRDLSLILVPMSILTKLQGLESEIKLLINQGPIIWMFEESEIYERMSEYTSLSPIISKLKAYGGQVGLILDDYLIDLDDEVYSLFDYFVLDGKRMKFVETDERALIKFKLTIQNFKIFSRPFITLDLTSESVIDSLPSNHVKIIGGDFIAPFADHNNPPPNRIVNRLKAIIMKQDKIYGKTS